MLTAFVDALVLAEPLQMQLWKSTGLTFTQLRILRRLRDGPMSAGHLAEAAGVVGPSLTRMLASLEQRGLISRDIDRLDRRRIVIRLTEPGSAALASSAIWRQSSFGRAARQMDDVERRAFVTTLRSFLRRVRENRAPADQHAAAAIPNGQP